jgi:hypothetical protein
VIIQELLRADRGQSQRVNASRRPADDRHGSEPDAATVDDTRPVTARSETGGREHLFPDAGRSRRGPDAGKMFAHVVRAISRPLPWWRAVPVATLVA